MYISSPNASSKVADWVASGAPLCYFRSAPAGYKEARPQIGPFFFSRLNHACQGAAFRLNPHGFWLRNQE